MFGGKHPSRTRSVSAEKPRKTSKSALREAREQVAQTNSTNLWFSRFSSRTAQVVGHPYVFLLAVASLIFWALTGLAFHFSDAWQLVTNTGTTIVTFLVVFLIQNTKVGQNRRETDAVGSAMASIGLLLLPSSYRNS